MPGAPGPDARPIRVVSFGSLNLDLAVRVPRRPGPDETLIAHGVEQFLGGKGANQATAAARLGLHAAMIGAVGSDAHGDAVLAGLRRNGVDTSFVRTVEGPTGLAIPLVADDGDLSIVVVPGANGLVDAGLAEDAAALLEGADVLLLQGEVPTEASLRAATIARSAGTLVLWSPAPVRADAARLLVVADLVIANRGEADALGLDPGRPDTVVTLGAGGALVAGRLVPALPAVAIDPTGAGDAFAAAVAVALVERRPLVDAVRWGCAAGACTVERRGAEPSFPTREELLARLAAGPQE